MWTRAELKFRGKEAFKANYWRYVLVGIIMTVTSGGFSTPNSYLRIYNNQRQNNNFPIDWGAFYSSTGVAIAFLVFFIALIVMVIVVALGIFLFAPLQVECNKFFLLNREDPRININPIGSIFGPYYLNIVKTMFFMNLYIFLWSLLFIVPGIIKSYEYRLVPFLIAENPEMDYKEALELSKKIMYGQKSNAFILDLSFIGWLLLSGITFGILGIFFVSPYIYATNTELYVTLGHNEKREDFVHKPQDSSTVEFTVE